MSPIKDLCLACEALNEEETFSEGDTITGTVTFTLAKETKVKSVVVKAKGDAHVSWSEGSGDDQTTYTAHKRYFKLKEYLVAENSKGTVLPKGVHCFKFRFNIPQGNMPPSFKGFHGKIVYMLEAKVPRGWLKCSQCPQSGSMVKEIGVFSKGQVQISATVNTKVCSPGDTLSVVAKICNSSSKKVKPKFRLEQKTVYHASGSTNSTAKTLCKIVGETIAQNSEESVSCQLTIPANANPTLQHCEIISVDHYLKVYLDISFAIDPEVVFPLVIVPSSFARSISDFPPPAVSMGPYPAGAIGAPSYSDFPPPAVSMGPYPAGAIGAPSYSDFPPPAFPIGPYPVPAGSGAYGYPAPVPTQSGTISGCDSQWPQQAPPFGFSTAASSLMQQQAPTAPPLGGDDPPSYMSLFYPSQDTLGRTGSDHKS